MEGDDGGGPELPILRSSEKIMARFRVERRWLASSPAGINEYLELELPGAWQPPSSSGALPCGEGKVAQFSFSHGNQIDSEESWFF
jgi:hypothetical protein